jgi:predicted nuclease with TOPRIM domain
MSTQRNLNAENERLKSENYRLNSSVQELRLEISYYQGETRRLEWEKNLLRQDVSRMSALFKGWLAELQSSNTRSVVQDADYFSGLIRRPPKAIADLLQPQSPLKLLLTTCQAPFYIEVSLEKS